MRSIFNILVLLVLIFLISGCATIFKGNSSVVDFSTKPSGADVYVNGFNRGKTPINLKLESKKTYNIEFKKDGYVSQTYTITNHVGGGWVILDILAGLVGVVIDAATGSWYDLDQDAINMILEEQQSTE